MREASFKWNSHLKSKQRKKKIRVLMILGM